MISGGSVKTLHDNFMKGWSVSKNEPCLGHRPVGADGKAGPYVWQTYDQVKTRMENFGSGMMHLDLAPASHDPEAEGMRFIGFYAKNCEEWVIAAQACNKFGVVVVPLYDTLGATAVKYVVNQTQLSTIICSGAEVPTVLDVASQCRCLLNVVVMSTADPAADKKWRSQYEAKPQHHLYIRQFAEIEEAGEANPADAPEIDASAVATFCYTSGTTGDPKGAMLTHDNIVTDMLAAISTGVNTRQNDVHISYLPLAHMFERIVQEALFHNGARIGFYQGDTTKLLNDIGALHPTIFPSVPRLVRAAAPTAPQPAGVLRSHLSSPVALVLCARSSTRSTTKSWPVRWPVASRRCCSRRRWPLRWMAFAKAIWSTPCGTNWCSPRSASASALTGAA